MATTKLAADKMRVSYVEAVNTHKAITLLSAVMGRRELRETLNAEP